MRNATFWLFAVAITGATALGSSSDLSIFQLQHTAWTARDGAPSPVFALAQTTDGFLWLGTSSGLYRFDGVRFEHFRAESGADLSGNDIFTLMATPDGGLWIGFRFGGADFLKDGRITRYGAAEGFPSKGTARRFAIERSGAVWAIANGQVLKLEGTHWQMIRAERSALDLIIDRMGTVWVSTATAVYSLRNGLFDKADDCDNGIYLAEAPTGIVWVLEYGPGGGVRPLGSPRSLRISAPNNVRFLFDRDGNLWSAGGKGILRVSGPKFGVSETFTKKDGATSDEGGIVLEDRDGNIWRGSYGGLDRFRESNLVPAAPSLQTESATIVAGDHGDIWGWSFPGPVCFHLTGAEIRTRPSEEPALTAHRDWQGTIWIGGWSALWRFENGRSIPVSFPEGGIKHSQVQAIAHDRSGNLWISVSGNGTFRLANNVWTKYGNLPNLPKETAISLLADSAGRVWFGHLGNKLSVVEGESVKTFSSADGFPVVNVQAIYEDSEHAIWASGERGLAVFHANRFQQVFGAGDLEFNGVSGIIETATGDLWLNSLAGIVRIPAAERRRVIADPAWHVHCELFDFVDGLIGKARQLNPVPTVIASSDGKLWFLTTGGIVRVDPEHLVRNTNPPAVFIRSVESNGRTYSQPGPGLPPRTTDIHIEYTAPSLSTPERVHFRYLLEGVDKDWRDVGSRREAFYTNLTPGRYHFRVTAANGAGNWNEADASLDFSIAPTWYQTRPFVLLEILSIIALAAIAIRWRMRLMAARLAAQFQQRLEERTRIAQDLHDTLLQGFISASLQLSLANREVTADSKAKPIVTEVLELMRTVIEEGRSAVRGMRLTQADTNDLEKSFSRIRAETVAEGPVNFRVLVEGPERALHALVRDDVYRIGREAIINAFRHAGAANVEVELRYSDRNLRLFVRDDGCGIEPQVLRDGRDGHWGLSGMRETAERIGARLRLQSRPGEGTEVELTVPAEIAFAALPRPPARRSWRMGWRIFRRRSRSNEQFKNSP
jgi:signal transduction histidine kinase/ligand-binding sensor domain-containing protein